jgi:hypothetical protein
MPMRGARGDDPWTMIGVGLSGDGSDSSTTEPPAALRIASAAAPEPSRDGLSPEAIYRGRASLSVNADSENAASVFAFLATSDSGRAAGVDWTAGPILGRRSTGPTERNPLGSPNRELFVLREPAGPLAS